MSLILLTLVLKIFIFHLKEDSSECGKRATLALAFKLMLSGRSELLIQALSILPTTTR